MIEKLQRLFFLIASAPQAGGRANSTEVTAPEHDPAEFALRQQLGLSNARVLIPVSELAGESAIEKCKPLFRLSMQRGYRE